MDSLTGVSAKIQTLIEEKMKRTPGLSYQEAWRIVLKENPDLASLYLGIIETPPQNPYPSGYEYGPVIQLNFNQQGGTTMANQNKVTVEPVSDMTEAGKKIDRLVRDYMFDHPEVDYPTAMKRVLDKYPDLKKAYVQTGVSFPDPSAWKYSLDDIKKDTIYMDVKDDPRYSLSVREEVHKKVMEYIHDTGESDYTKAMTKVLEADPSLKEAYAKS